MKNREIKGQALINDLPMFLVLAGRISRRLQGRFESLFRSVWNRIPEKDQTWILAKARKYQEGLRVLLSRGPFERTNGWANDNKGMIGFDAWFVDAATDRLVKAIISHELGHVRAYADPIWPDNSEAVACLYAERLWRFSGGDPVFKSEMCHRLDVVFREMGLKAQVFQYRTVELNGEVEDTYLLLPDGQKLDFHTDLNLDRIGGGGDKFEIIAAGIRSSNWSHVPAMQAAPRPGWQPRPRVRPNP